MSVKASLWKLTVQFRAISNSIINLAPSASASSTSTTTCSRLKRTFCARAKTSSSTIFALSSGQGKCGVAVIRVSGPSCAEAVKSVCRMTKLLEPRCAMLKKLYDPTSGEMIDKGLVLWFPGPGSFTGEDCAEFQVHGGTAVVAAMLDVLGTLPGLQPAEAGDFTKRAFLNGKLDVTEVEGLADLIHADTAAQRRQALRQMEGELGNLYANWRNRILKCLADVEAFIDFSEDENIEEDIIDRATAEVQKVRKELQNHLLDNRRGERLRDGVHVAIVGEANVGKSSLFNAICQRPAAIVSPVAGTTRDIVEASINLAGYPVVLSDTAGLRESSDLVEKEGVRRALDRAHKADIRLLVLDASSFLPAKPSQISWADYICRQMTNMGIGKSSAINSSVHDLGETNSSSLTSTVQTSLDVNTACCGSSFSNAQESVFLISEMLTSGTQALPLMSNSGITRNHIFEEKMAFRVQATESSCEFQYTDLEAKKSVKIDNSRMPASKAQDAKQYLPENVIVALNKSDLVSADICSSVLKSEELGDAVACLSCATGDHLDSLLSLLTNKVKCLCGDPLAGSPSLTQARHRTHLTHCLHHLSSFLVQANHDTVMAAQALRRAMRELGRVTGRVHVEEILDVIFKDFCIGK